MLYLVEEEADICIWFDLRWELVGFCEYLVDICEYSVDICEYLVDICEYLVEETDISLFDLRSELGGSPIVPAK